MRLYYFTPDRFGLEAIRDRRLKIAQVNELNDPFEFMGLALTSTDRAIWKILRSKLSQRFGLICMSQNWQHPLLWSHYADKHRGLCLGFDVADRLVSKIEYRDTRPKLSDLQCEGLHQLEFEHLQRILLLKFSGWSYESEYRLFLKLEDKDPVSEIYFRPFSKSMKLAQVIVGERSLVTRSKLAEVLGELAETVTAFKARAAFNTFKVVENKLQRAWK